MAGRYKLLNPIDLQRENKGVKQVPSEELVEGLSQIPSTQLPVDVSDEEIKERPVLVPLKDKEIMQSIGLVRQYLRDTGVNANMNKLTSALLQNKLLPYNPYPGYIRRFMKLSEKFHTRRETLELVQRRISQCPTFLTGTGILSGVKLPEAKLWGLKHILNAINPKILDAYRNIIKSCSVDKAKIKEKYGDSVTLLPSITGPCMFSGSLYDQCFKLDICVSLIVTASDFQIAAKILGTAVLTDIEYIFNNSDHLVISLSVPVVTNNNVEKKIWNADEIQSLLSSSDAEVKENLIQTIGFAALKKYNAHLQLLLNIGKNFIPNLRSKYIKAEKSYNLMTLMKGGQGQATKAGQLSLFISTAQYQALHEGLFIEQSEAELYLSTFKKYSSAKSPFSQNVSNAVQKHWQEKIAGLKLQYDLREILHYLFLIECIQHQNKPATAKNEDSLSMEICRILQGLGPKLENISILITTLHNIASARFLQADSEIFQDILSLCQKCMMEFFDETSHELHSTVSSAGHVMKLTLEKVNMLSKDKSFSQIKQHLDLINGYIKSLSIGLIEDSLDEFSTIRNTHTQINNIQQKEFGLNYNVDVRPDAFRHKAEITSFTNIDQKKLDLSSTNVTAPPQILQHAARMQYCIDVRIDEVWKNFMQNMLVRKNNLPANPYPSLITLLRQASLKVQLFREDNSVIVRRLLHSNPKLYDETLQMFTMPGISAYGTFSAVYALNSVGFKQISAMASSVAISAPKSGIGTPTITAGAFQLKCLMAVSNESLLYRSATPYLNTVTINEHCFIRGPQTQQHDGIVALSKVILINLGNLQTQGILPLKACFAEVDLELHDLNGISTRFQNQFTSCLESQKPITVQLLIPMDWRHVLVKKTIHISFINEMTDGTSFLTKHDSVTPLRQVFLNGNDAVEYTKRIRIYEQPSQDILKSKASEMCAEFNWSNFAQFVLIHELNNNAKKDFDQKTMERIAFCWKLFHSPHGSLQYCASLNEAIRGGLKYAKSASSEMQTLKEHLETMLAGYRNVLHTTLTSPSTMAASSLNLYCQDLIEKASPVNLSRTGGLSRTLTYISNLTEAISDSLATDLLNCAPSVQILTNTKK